MVATYASFPPEINSSLIYTGPGSLPLMEAALSWTLLSEQLTETAGAIHATLCSLMGAWCGPSADSMMAAGLAYTSWLTTLAAQTSETAGQVSAAVVAYEVAFAATVPPPVVAANRALLAALVSTNFLGVNTPAIMATEAHYVEMWAQDVAAMAEYDLASVQATVLPTFTPLVSTLSPLKALGSIFAPGSNQATTGLAGVLNLLSGQTGSSFGSFINASVINSIFSSGFYYGLPTQGLQALTSFVALTSLGQTERQISLAEQAANPPTSPTPEGAVAGGDAAPTPAMGGAQKVGPLSTPQSWGPPPNQLNNAEEQVATPMEGTPMMAMPLAGAQSSSRDRARYGRPVQVISEGKWN
jgi:PPE-repeat protein